MLGPGQDVAIEDPGGITLDRLGQEPAAGNDQLSGSICGFAHDGRWNGGFHATELAVEGRNRSDPVELPFQERRPGRGLKAAGNVSHDLDEMAEQEFAVVLSLGDISKEGIDGSGVDHPVQGKPGHDRRRRPFRERVKNGWKNHETSLSKCANPVQLKKL